MATVAISAISSGIGIVTKLLGQHTARVKGATTENQAAAQIIPLYDADLAEIATAFTTGQDDAATCIASLQSVDAQVYQYLHAQVGAPGTMWAGTGCNKSCTVGCCVYNNDLRPGIMNLIAAIQNGSGVAFIPQVYGDKYGLQTRPMYNISIVTPPASAKVTGAVTSLVDQLLGRAPASSALPGGAAANTPQNTNSLLLVGFGVLAVIAAFAAGGRR